MLKVFVVIAYFPSAFNGRNLNYCKILNFKYYVAGNPSEEERGILNTFS